MNQIKMLYNLEKELIKMKLGYLNQISEIEYDLSTLDVVDFVSKWNHVFSETFQTKLLCIKLDVVLDTALISTVGAALMY